MAPLLVLNRIAFHDIFPIGHCSSVYLVFERLRTDTLIPCGGSVVYLLRPFTAFESLVLESAMTHQSPLQEVNIFKKSGWPESSLLN